MNKPMTGTYNYSWPESSPLVSCIGVNTIVHDVYP